MAYSYTTTVRKESKFFPGVFFTLRKMSEERRAQLRLCIAEPTARVRNILRELNKLDKVAAEQRTDEQVDRMLDLSDDVDRIGAQEIDPAWLRWGCKKIEGLEIENEDGEVYVADVEALIKDGPPTLFDEIVAEIKSVAQLTGEEEKNSESPTTSGAGTDGTTQSTIAASAENGGTSESTETASTTQS